MYAISTKAIITFFKFLQAFPLQLQIEIISSVPALTSALGDDESNSEALVTELQSIAEVLVRPILGAL
jgi:hypothetical protein